jgi:ketose-bisphosphate aldolase
MALVTLKEMLADAQKNKYAIPAFDVSNYEMVRAVADVCKEERSPILFMGLEYDFAGTGRDYIANLCKLTSDLYDVPVCLHLDHAENLENIKKAIDAGFSSVMFDGSSLPFEENIAKTAEVVKYAHAHGVTVEAELGHVANAIAGTEAKNEAVDSEEDIENALTRPEEAAEFIERTDVDCLAVAIGTAHGVYVKAPTLRIDRLDLIREAAQRPLVLHGGSGTPDDQVKTAIEHGICKINIYSEVLKALNTGLRDKLNSVENMSMWPCFIYEEAFSRMHDVIRDKIRVFGSNNRV